MRTEIEIQKENVQFLHDLIKENPEVRIVPLVNSKIVEDDGYASWMGSVGKSEIDYIWDNGERIFFKSQDEEELIEKEMYAIEDEVKSLDENHSLSKAIGKRAVARVEGYKWEKVIVLWIGVP
ncbi:hypothetical protein IGJ74_000809 [Enterococcus sp. AZ009]|uniref:hypothetical protein n=1 Tax=Enterococcus sp. AZ009 TaxID=2774766 RepID=UPI001C443A98|nr:hypothetical protein [Enterococcus casseliflavus]